MDVLDHIQDIFMDLQTISMEKIPGVFAQRGRSMTVSFKHDRLVIACADNQFSRPTQHLYSKLTEPSNDQNKNAALFVISRLLPRDTLRDYEFRKLEFNENKNKLNFLFQISSYTDFKDINKILELLVEASGQGNAHYQAFIRDLISSMPDIPVAWLESHSKAVDIFYNSLPLEHNDKDREIAYKFCLYPDIFSYIIINSPRLSALKHNWTWGQKPTEEDAVIKNKFLSHLEKQKLSQSVNINLSSSDEHTRNVL